MLSLIAGCVLSAVAQDATKDVVDLAKKVAEADSYTFEMTSEGDGMGRFGRRRGGGEGGGEAAGGGGGEGRRPPGAGAAGAAGEEGPVTTTGKFQRTKPEYAKRADLEFYRAGEQVVYKTPEGQWKALEQGEGGAGGGSLRRAGQGGEPGGEGGQGAGGGGPGGGRGDRRGMMTRMLTASVQFPHEMLKNLDAKLASATKEEKDGKIIFTGSLNDKGAEDLSGLARMKEMMARGGGGESDLKASGTIQFILDGSGNLEQIDLLLNTKGTMGGQPFDRKRTAKIKVKDIGATTVEVPAEVSSQIKT